MSRSGAPERPPLPLRTHSFSGEVAFLVTCEHGGNDVPEAYRDLFRGGASALASHRGWDPGALSLARRLARALDAPLHASTTTRLLVDLNRSPHHRGAFSEFSRTLPRDRREAVLRTLHEPYRHAVDDAATALGGGGRTVVHVGVHSFTPVFNGTPRGADLALLYDPRRPREREFANRWSAALRARRSALRIRRNHPYRGASDGLTTWLRGARTDGAYLGLELEVSQGLLNGDGAFPDGLVEDVVGALRAGASGAGATPPGRRRNRGG